MKQIKKETIVRWKKPGTILPKVDYSMNTCYYRVFVPAHSTNEHFDIGNGQGEFKAVFHKAAVLGASVDPIIAIGYMKGHKKAELWEVKL